MPIMLSSTTAHIVCICSLLIIPHSIYVVGEKRQYDISGCHKVSFVPVQSYEELPIQIERVSNKIGVIKFDIKYKYKKYVHFDKRVHIEDAKKYIENPSKVATHSFYPFIHFTNKWIKYSATNGRREKPRDLCYAAHMDSYIYQLYAYKLNCAYNAYVKEKGINKCAIAYRDNLSKSNIEFAKEVLSFAIKTGEAYIIVGDFTHFFDELQHKYLKKMICMVLGVDSLSDDLYAVFKNITKYSIVELDDLLAYHGDITYKEFNKKDIALTPDEFRKFKSGHLKSNKNKSYGIPQGSPISSILSNIYMIEFDKALNDFATTNQGIYRRYSDDFIMVIPKSEHMELKCIWEYVKSTADLIPRLILQSDKTQVFYLNNQNLTNENVLVLGSAQNGKDILEYLGFAFDGKNITVRDKTVSKYYYRMYRKVNRILTDENKLKKRVPKYKLYKQYSHLGSHKYGAKNGNFISYINRCEKVFGTDEKVNLVKKRHWKKLHKRLNSTAV